MSPCKSREGKKTQLELDLELSGSILHETRECFGLNISDPFDLSSIHSSLSLCPASVPQHLCKSSLRSHATDGLYQNNITGLHTLLHRIKLSAVRYSAMTGQFTYKNSLVLPETGHIYCTHINIYILQQMHSLAGPTIKPIQTIKNKIKIRKK